MATDELCFTPATELVSLIKAKELSPVELMAAVLARAEALQPKLNPFCLELFDQTRADAAQAEQELQRGADLGPLHGLPWTIKDLVFAKGQPVRAGSFIHASRVAQVDAPIVERMRAAGAIAIGRTTVPELGWIGYGESPLTGISHNPWKHGYNAGGSSTGAAICAAAGIGPLHQGSDGAGSIRMPAAFCGIFGIKPSYGRIPYWPTPNNDEVSHLGPMTRTVADAALMLEVAAGPDDRDLTSLEGRPAAYSAELETGIRGKRIAYSADLGYLKVDRDIAECVSTALPAFAEQGALIEEVGPLWEDPHQAELVLWSSAYAGQIGHLLDEFEDRMDPGLVACTRAGMGWSAADFIRAKARRLQLWDEVRAVFERYDLLVTPTLSVAAFPVGRIIPEHWEQHAWDWLRWAGFSYPFNLTHVPAATCPCGFTAAGLPVGLQIVGGRFQDLLVLQASRAFEQARPWAQRRPPV